MGSLFGSTNVPPNLRPGEPAPSGYPGNNLQNTFEVRAARVRGVDVKGWPYHLYIVEVDPDRNVVRAWHGSPRDEDDKDNDQLNAFGMEPDKRSYNASWSIPVPRGMTSANITSYFDRRAKQLSSRKFSYELFSQNSNTVIKNMIAPLHSDFKLIGNDEVVEKDGSVLGGIPGWEKLFGNHFVDGKANLTSELTFSFDGEN